MAIGAPGVSLEWSTGLALAAGASEDEIAEVLLAIAPVAGLGRVVAAAPSLGTALGYDVAAARNPAASEEDRETAAQDRDALASKMTASQITQAQRRAQELAASAAGGREVTGR